MARMSLIKLVFFGVTIALAIPSFALADTNLVANGSFEITTSPSGGAFTDWTTFGDFELALDGSGVYCLKGGIAGILPSDGVCQGYFGSVGDTDGIEQTLASSPTGRYDVSFDVVNIGPPADYFAAQLGTQTLYSYTDIPEQYSYQHYSFKDVAAGPTPTLSFTFQQDPSYILLDNVVVVGAPEPAWYAVLALGLAGLLIAMFRRKIA